MNPLVLSAMMERCNGEKGRGKESKDGQKELLKRRPPEVCYGEEGKTRVLRNLIRVPYPCIMIGRKNYDL